MTMEIRDFNLRIGEEIKVRHAGMDASSVASSSRIIGAFGTDFHISWPEVCGAKMRVDGDTDLFVTLVRDGSLYGIGAMVVGMKKDEPATLSIRLSGPVQRFQKRAFVRVAAKLELEFIPHRDPGGAAAHRPESVLHSVTLNISENGFAIRAENPFTTGSIYDVRLKLPRHRVPLNFRARVVRSDVSQTGTADQPYEIGFSMMCVSEAVRRQIRSFVIRFQQESLHYDWQ